MNSRYRQRMKEYKNMQTCTGDLRFDVSFTLEMMLLPCFCNDFRCYICWRPTDSVERSVHHSCQTKVSQFQAFAAICMLIHLKPEKIHTIKSRILKDCNMMSTIWTVQHNSFYFSCIKSVLVTLAAFWCVCVCERVTKILYNCLSPPFSQCPSRVNLGIWGLVACIACCLSMFFS